MASPSARLWSYRDGQLQDPANRSFNIRKEPGEAGAVESLKTLIAAEPMGEENDVPPTQVTGVPFPDVVDHVDARDGKTVRNRCELNWNSSKNAVVGAFEETIYRNTSSEDPRRDSVMEVDMLMCATGQVDTLVADAVKPSPRAVDFGESFHNLPSEQSRALEKSLSGTTMSMSLKGRRSAAG